MTAVPAPKIGPRGFVPPDELDVLAGVQSDISAAFGGGLNSALETPQGQLASSLAAIIGHSNDLFLAFVNQVDPAYAEGRMQDAIARIYFLERNSAEPTVVQATCRGLVGTIIPAGALARASDGNLYVCTLTGAIGGTGTVSLPFACTVSGPIACAPTALNTIYRTIFGWDSISNPAQGVLGRNVETRAEFEQRRAASVALNSAGSLPAVRAAVLNVPGVLDAYVTENPTGTALVVGGVSIAPRSLFVSVVGGDALAVATAIWRKKSPGCGYTGNTTINVVDANSGYVAPLPSYPVTFTVPTPLRVRVAVQLASGPNVPSDAVAQVQAVVQAAFAGADGGRRAQIGGTIYASRYYAAVAALGPWVQIVSINVGPAAGATLASMTAQIDQVPTINAADVAVTLA